MTRKPEQTPTTTPASGATETTIPGLEDVLHQRVPQAKADLAQRGQQLAHVGPVHLRPAIWKSWMTPSGMRASGSVASATGPASQRATASGAGLASELRK